MDVACLTEETANGIQSRRINNPHINVHHSIHNGKETEHFYTYFTTSQSYQQRCYIEKLSTQISKSISNNLRVKSKKLEMDLRICVLNFFIQVKYRTHELIKSCTCYCTKVPSKSSIFGQKTKSDFTRVSSLSWNSVYLTKRQENGSERTRIGRVFIIS